MKKIWLPAFILVAFANLAGVLLDYKLLIFITKPFLMPLLGIWLAVETSHQPPRFLKKMMFAGLSFATLGDVLLLFGEQPFFFMLGLVAFLFTHLSYIGGFSSISNLDKGFLRKQPAWVLPFVIYALGLVFWLWPGIPAATKLPVSIYAAVITGMALSVFNLKGNISAQSFQSLFAGALLFMLSDSLIALSRFGGNFNFPGWVVMTTYLLGQFLIVNGVRHVLTTRRDDSKLSNP
jgi:uncharacterized membrane protein YhhN